MSGIVGKNLGRGSGLVKVSAVGADSVTGASIVDDAIDSEHYTDASIDTAHIGASQITNSLMADNAIGLAEMAGGTDGNIISYDTSGNPVAVATGTDGQVLTSSGAGTVCAFEDAGGGGKVLQVVHAEDTTQVTLTSGSFADISISAAITPSATSSKVLVIMSGVASSNSQSNALRGKIYRDDSAVSAQFEMASYNESTNDRSYDVWAANYLDSPSTTSEVIYNLRAIVIDGETYYVGRWAYDGTSSPTQITLMEIVA